MGKIIFKYNVSKIDYYSASLLLIVSVLKFNRGIIEI